MMRKLFSDWYLIIEIITRNGKTLKKLTPSVPLPSQGGGRGRVLMY
jgi:hypothetical protein